MIDSHCHLEQRDYDKDRDSVIKKCKENLKAVISSCANPKDLKLTLKLVKKYKNFVFTTIGIHPEYIKNISEGEKEDFMDEIRKNKDKIVGIGEVGLDFNWVKEPEWKDKQRKWFSDFIALSKELDLPLVIHSRDAHEDVIKILEEHQCERVLLHMWGDHKFSNVIIDNGWFVSMNTIILKSKSYRKVVKNLPIENLMLETDSPWLHPKSLGTGKKVRNDPTSIKIVAKKMAELKKLDFERVWEVCSNNSINFFRLSL